MCVCGLYRKFESLLYIIERVFIYTTTESYACSFAYTHKNPYRFSVRLPTSHNTEHIHQLWMYWASKILSKNIFIRVYVSPNWEPKYWHSTIYKGDMLRMEFERNNSTSFVFCSPGRLAVKNPWKRKWKEKMCTNGMAWHYGSNNTSNTRLFK